MLTLDTHPEEIISHPLMLANQLCRTAVRVRRWNDATMRALLGRPVQTAVLDACQNIQQKLWHLCDDELRAAVLAYLRKANG